MYGTKSAFIFLAIAALILTGGSSAFAQSSPHTWVSSVNGRDSNPCTSASPCLTFSGALAQTAPYGVISVQTPGDYGPVTINESVTIDGGGMFAGIPVSSSTGTTGITITGGSAVVLKGLSIYGDGTTGLTGVDITSSSGSTSVEKCFISNLTTYGIEFQPSAPSQLFVSDTTIENIGPGSSTSAGIYMTSGTSSSGTIVKSTASIDNTRIEGSGTGVWMSSAYMKGTVTRCSITGSTNQGINVQGNSNLCASSCVLANSGKGPVLVNAGNSKIVLGDDTLVNNVYPPETGAKGGTYEDKGTNVQALN